MYLNDKIGKTYSDLRIESRVNFSLTLKVDKNMRFN